MKYQSEILVQENIGQLPAFILHSAV